jgi:anaerobic magnesium-protoporphyrin IX monomethyl ester cyclase
MSMRILLINPPHPAIGSRIPGEQLPPLGLLAIGGPLIDAGHHVELLNADLMNMSTAEIVRRAIAARPDAVLLGHSGSTSAHPIIMRLTRRLREALARVWIVYGGVFPTYHWRDILDQERQIDVIVRGEGEDTVVRLMAAIEGRKPLQRVAGIAFRESGMTVGTGPAPMIRDLDQYRVGWELIDHKDYGYYGGKRGVVMQFSRGCPHLCTYCGQRGFWTRFRHRDPKLFAAEIARLHREHGVDLINLADENPTSSKKAWKALLEAIIAENIKVTIIGTTRADDIVRDADILHLYRKAGIERFLLGVEHTDEATLAHVRKGATAKCDREAIRLMRQHGILSLATFVLGFEDETDRDYWRALRQLIAYDPDQITLLHSTPHRWTPFYRDVAHRAVVQTDQRLWDYKHQVLATNHMPPWRVFLWQKAIEAIVQGRPKALWRTYFNRDPAQSHGMRWYARMGRGVWLREIGDFLWRESRLSNGPTLARYWGESQAHEEEALSAAPRSTLQQEGNSRRQPYAIGSPGA